MQIANMLSILCEEVPIRVLIVCASFIGTNALLDCFASRPFLHATTVNMVVTFIDSDDDDIELSSMGLDDPSLDPNLHKRKSSSIILDTPPSMHIAQKHRLDSSPSIVPLSSDPSSPDVQRPKAKRPIMLVSPDASPKSYNRNHQYQAAQVPRSKLISQPPTRTLSVLDRVIGDIKGISKQDAFKNSLQAFRHTPSPSGPPPEKKRKLVQKGSVREASTPPTSISSDESEAKIEKVVKMAGNIAWADAQRYLDRANGKVAKAVDLAHDASTNKVTVTDRERQLTFISRTKDRAKANAEVRKTVPSPVKQIFAPSVNKAPVPSKPFKRKRRDYGSDGGDFSGSDDDEDAFEVPPSPALLAEIFEFLNNATVSELVDTVAVSEEQAQIISSMRPFSNLDDARLRLRKTKGVSDKVIDAYAQNTQIYEAVDVLIAKCEEIGQDISKAVASWGASRSDGGIDLVETQGIRDKGYIQTQPPNIGEDIQLKGYQMVGVNWLNLLYSKGLSCILADEMGLGKTCQVIALFAHLATQGHMGPHLVVVPSSTIENWMREFARFCPTLDVRAYYGGQKDRMYLRHELRDEQSQWNVLVTTYNLATGAKDDRSFLRRFNFQACVFDEGHMLKNCFAQRYNALMALNANFRLLLTGTPLQNNLQELVSLLTFILPQVFEESEEDLRQVFKIKGTAELSHVSKKRIARAKAMMTPFVLRRKKVQVLKEIPPKHSHLVYCDMTPDQKLVYSEHEAKSRKAIEGKLTPEPETISKGKKTMHSSGTSNVLMALRQTANHPMLFRRMYTDKTLREMSKRIMREEVYADADPQILFEDMEVMADFELHRLCKQFPSIARYALTNTEWMDAGKVQQLAKMLPEMIAKGDRILLFSQFTRTLDILEAVMDTLGFKYCRMDGQTKVDERQPLLDRFTDDDSIPVFLLSTRAGGFGINLTAANAVILYDSDFNPHNDKQAEDRAHRVGQLRQVDVYKFVTRGTIEEYILGLATSKLDLDQRISDNQEEDEVQVKKMETGLLEMLRKKWAEEKEKS